jgi:Holliday junction resolvasome RuvABC endonuclease subunit
MSRYILTLDNGIASAGITIYDSETKKYKFLVFCDKSKYKWIQKTKNKKCNIDHIDDNFELHIYLQDDKKYENCQDNFERLIKISRDLKKLIKEHLDSDDVDFYFEEVAFSRGQSNTISQYATLVKYGLYVTYGHVIGKPLYNSSVKKVLAGNGKASKEDVIDAMSKKSPIHKQLINIIESNNIRVDGGGFFEDLTDSFMLNLYVQEVKNG